MPTISRFQGIAIRMYFRDHPPPHFHAEYGGMDAHVAIDASRVNGSITRILDKKTGLDLLLEPCGGGGLLFHLEGLAKILQGELVQRRLRGRVAGLQVDVLPGFGQRLLDCRRWETFFGQRECFLARRRLFHRFRRRLFDRLPEGLLERRTGWSADNVSRRNRRASQTLSSTASGALHRCRLPAHRGYFAEHIIAPPPPEAVGASPTVSSTAS